MALKQRQFPRLSKNSVIDGEDEFNIMSGYDPSSIDSNSALSSTFLSSTAMDYIEPIPIINPCHNPKRRRQSLQTSLPPPIIGLPWIEDIKSNDTFITNISSNASRSQFIYGTPKLSNNSYSNTSVSTHSPLTSIDSPIKPPRLGLINTASCATVDDEDFAHNTYKESICTKNSERNGDTPDPFQDNGNTSKLYQCQQMMRLYNSSKKLKLKRGSKTNPVPKAKPKKKRQPRDSIEIGAIIEERKEESISMESNHFLSLSFPTKIEPFYKLLKDFDWNTRNYIASGAQSKCYMVVKKNTNKFANIDIPPIVAIKVTAMFGDEDEDRYIKENELLHIYGGIKTYKIYLKHTAIGECEYYFVQDLVDVTLYDVIYNENSSLKHLKYEEREQIAKSYIHQLLLKLQLIHKNGNLIHGDLKPGNILIKKSISGGAASISDEVKIIDFGLCKHCKYGKSLNRERGYFFGTLGYAPPELYKYKRSLSYNHCIDIWSIGVILIEIIMLKNPFYYDKLMKNARYLKKNNPKYREKSLFDLEMGIYWQFVKNLNIEKDIIENLKWEPNVLGIPGVSSNCIDFIELCLKTDINQRCTAQELLRHDWFK